MKGREPPRTYKDKLRLLQDAVDDGVAHAVLSGPDVGGSTATENHVETMLDGEVRRSRVRHDRKVVTGFPNSNTRKNEKSLNCDPR